MNLPTQLTVGRICLVPLVVAFLISNESTHALVAAILFLGAALTDWLDGLIARRLGQVTTLGKLLDPVADKVLVSAAQGLVIEASDLGKYKTFAQYVAVTLLILERSVPSGYDAEFVYLSRGMLWAALTLTVFSGIDYFVRFYRASDVDALVRGEDRWR